MSKWIEIEVTGVDITKCFKQVEDEFEWFVDGKFTTLYIYQNINHWMKQIFEYFIKQNITFTFIPCNFERYNIDITFSESYTTFDYLTYFNF